MFGLILSFFSSFIFKIGAGIVVAIAIAIFTWQIKSHFAEFERLKIAETALIELVETEIERSKKNQIAYEKREKEHKKNLAIANRRRADEKRWGDQARDQIINLQSRAESDDGPVAPVLARAPWMLNSPSKNDNRARGHRDKARGAGEP